jgi:hypothetical protein
MISNANDPMENPSYHSVTPSPLGNAHQQIVNSGSVGNSPVGQYTRRHMRRYKGVDNERRVNQPRNKTSMVNTLSVKAEVGVRGEGNVPVSETCHIGDCGTSAQHTMWYEID